MSGAMQNITDRTNYINFKDQRGRNQWVHYMDLLELKQADHNKDRTMLYRKNGYISVLKGNLTHNQAIYDKWKQNRGEI